MSWGYRIVLLYVGFVGLIVTLVSMSVNQRLDMVTPQYYQEELNFQSKIERREAARSLEQPLSWTISDEQILLNFPKEFTGKKIEADIVFFRPSDARKDQKVKIEGKELEYALSTKDLEAGYWEMKIEWKAGDQAFFDETSFNVKH
jgi:hypothetical protein